MSARRRRNIFQTRDERFNYRFGNPAMRKRYRVRSKRRLIIAICVLLVLLLIAAVVLTLLFRKDDAAPAGQTTPETVTEEPAETTVPAEQDTSSDTEDSSEASPSDGQDEQTEPAASLSPVAVAAREAAAAGADAQPEETAEPADTDEQTAEPAAAAKPLLGSVRDAAAGRIDARRSDWHLLLVNQWHPIPDDFTLETLTLLNGLDIDTRAADDLDAMIDDCFNAGYQPLIASAYRSTDYQQQLFEELQYNWINEGYSEEEAYAKAAEEIAIPGTSEHECGLAVDIVDQEYQVTDEAQADTATQQWLLEHSWEYGFILRYPEDKTEITGKIYEPWHYRYVGREYAKDMHDKNLCLEEYVWMTDHPESEISSAD